jgi:2,3-bisphosphoglycerate-independent phosphoglycerate mutase
MVMKRKSIIVIQDGVGDRPVEVLGGKTPLEAANTPALDEVANNGICGLMDPVAPGVRVGTDVGHLALFGLDPYQDYYGRGPIEAAGIGLSLQEGDVAFRVNFATIDEDYTVIDRRAGRIREGVEKLASEVDGLEIDTTQGPVKVIFRPATEHRAVLVLRGEGLSDGVNDSDPLAGHVGEKIKTVQPLEDTREARKTAEAINKLTQVVHELFKKHPVNIQREREGLPPANVILVRSPGKLAKIKQVTERYGIKGACITAEDTIKGAARMAGYSVYWEPGMTASLDTDTGLKGRLALKALQENDLVYIHIKGTDLCGHDNRPEEKVKLIEKVDKMVELILRNIPEDVYVALTADHSTPCETGIHTGEPVPIAIKGSGVRRDSVHFYNEIDCACGGLNRINGVDFFMTIADLMGITHKYGS